MRRDYITLHVRPAATASDGPAVPTIVVEYDGPNDLLADRLQHTDGDPLDAADIDVAFRLQTAPDADDATGVFSLTDRLTGEYVLEANVAAEQLLELIPAARKDEDTGDCPGCYRVELRQDDDTRTFEKETLLVYDDEGSLLRQHSLIPSGVEL